MGIFDRLQKTTQAVVTKTMGYQAQWSPIAGGGPFIAEVLFNEPTNQEQVGEIDYEALRPRLECFEGDFPGLLDSVRANNPETVIINGRSFTTIKNGSRKFDGKTIIIYLEEEQ